MYRRTPIFFRIAESFFRHQLLFWSALLIVSGVTMSVLIARSKTFRATATTQVQSESIASVLGASDTNTWITPAQKNADRFNELLRQNQPDGFLDQSLKEANLSQQINLSPKADDPRYALLQKNLSASPDSTNQFSIGLTWDNQDECEKIVSALRKKYIEEVGVDRALTSTASVSFLNQQIHEVAVKMHGAETALTDFKKSNGGQLSDAESAYNNQRSSLQQQLADRKITFGDNGRRKVFLLQQLVQMRPMSIAEQTVSDQSPLEREIAVLLAKRDTELSSGKTPRHPDVAALDTRISQLEKQQRTNAKAPENQRNTQTKLQDNPQYQALKLQIAEAAIAQDAEQMQIQNMNQQIASLEGLIHRIPDQQRRLTDKTRDYATLKTLYDTLTKRRQDVGIQASLDKLTASSSLVPIGTPYASPTTGNTKMIAMLIGSILLGCLVGGILVVLSEWADHSLRHEIDAERLLGVPVLAALPESADLRLTGPRHLLTGGGVPALTASVPEGN